MRFPENTLMHEDSWEWPDKARKKLHPRRGGVEAKFRKVLSPRVAFKGLAQAYGKHVADGGLKAQSGPAFERLCAPLAKEAPDLLGADDEASMLKHFYSMPFGAELVDFWMGQDSATFALEALLAAHRLSNWDEPGWYTPTHCLQNAWTRLRARLSVAEKAEYESALSLARSLWKEADFEVRQRLAYAFPAELEWAHIVADAYPERPRTRVELLYHSVTDPRRMDMLVDRSVWWETGIFISFLEGAGLSAVESLVPLLGRAKKTPERKIVYESLSLIPSDAAMSALIECDGDRAMTPFLTSAAMRWPTRAQRLVSEALTTKKSATLGSLIRAVETAMA